MNRPRLRQLVFACEELTAADDLRDLLDLGEPFADPGVAAFGLDNAVFALGDQFLEIVAPQPDKAANETAAGRFLSRAGPGGYMAIFEVESLAAARAHVDAQGIRRVWNADFDSIAASHLHPADVGAAILSLDQPEPPGSWTWAGPDWQDRSRPGGLTGARFEAPEPTILATKWARALDLEVDDNALALHQGELRFGDGETERLAGFCIAVDDIAAILQHAGKLNLPTTENSVLFQGVTLHLEQR